MRQPAEVCETQHNSVADPESGKEGGGAQKHEIYMTTFESHLFMTYYYKSWMAPLDPLLNNVLLEHRRILN